MKLSALILVLSLAAPAMARDINLLNKMAGRYPISDLNGTTAVTGVLEVVASSSEGVGYRLVDVVGENGTNAANVEVLTAASATVVSTEADAIVQEFKAETHSLRVEYRAVEGGVHIHAIRCPVGGGCELTQVNSESSPTEVVEPAQFFASIAGGYRIELVGDEHPHDGNDSADVSASGGEANLTFPYCQNAGGLCDPGYIDLPFASTKVSRKLVSPGRYLYTIVSGANRYTWEERSGQVFFRNYQYKLASGRIVTLTHVLKKL